VKALYALVLLLVLASCVTQIPVDDVTADDPLPAPQDPSSDSAAPSEPTSTSGQGFFDEPSTWYLKIPTDHPISPRSDEHIADILINSPRMYANYREWSVPIWYAEDDTPIVEVEVRGTRYKQEAESRGWNQVPIPPDAMPAYNEGALSGKYHDGHMVVISHDGRYSWEFFRAIKHPDGRWSTSNVRRWDLSGDGMNDPYDRLGDVRACATSLLQGLVTYDEVKEGRIEHALTFAYWGEKKANHQSIYPCGSYTRAGVSERPGAMLMGERLQLNPDLDLDTLDLTDSERVVAQALQEYGMIFVENCAVGCNAIYFESLEDKPESWGSLLPDLRKIPLDEFRVVEPVRPD
jgi:hypothetical protein